MTDTTGIGPQRPDEYRGWLTFDYLPAELQRAEDSTLNRDNHIDLDHFERPTTPAELTLLAHLGFELPDEPLLTRVDRITPTLRHRSWPALKSQSTNGS